MNKSDSLVAIIRVSASKVVAVAKQLGHTSPEVLADWAERASNGRLIMLAAKLNDKFVGSVNLILDGADEQPVIDEVGRVPMINALGVLDSHRRKGVAGLLLDEAERLASDYNDVVILGVGINNSAARNLYDKRGYEPQTVGGHQTYVTTWPEVDELGNPRIEFEECNLMIKKIAKNS